MPGSSEASVANASVNVTPIKTRYVCTPERGTIHPEIKSRYDSWINNYVAPWRIIEPLTNSAMVEQWVLPVNSLSTMTNLATSLIHISMSNFLFGKRTFMIQHW
mmetsp:Transcript_12980/g.23860  ORF Transcript_12980/g.23860 Transcript_12980/m.23860 type:complete len:104 (-) Transcript_12980:89-400(-)